MKPVLNVRKKCWRRLTLLLLLCLLLIGGSVLLWQNNSVPQPETEPPEAEPDIAEVIGRKATAAASGKYGLTIRESGPGYELRFAGIADGERLYGEIEGYDLLVYACRGQFYVKNKEAEEWQAAAAAELDALPVLLRDPHQLLAAMLSAGDLQAEAGEKRTVENVICETYVLEPAAVEAELVTSFNAEATLEKLKLYLWFAEEDGFLRMMAMAMDFRVNGEAVHISRRYIFSPDGGSWPEGLPQTEGFTHPL